MAQDRLKISQLSTLLGYKPKTLGSLRAQNGIDWVIEKGKEQGIDIEEIEPEGRGHRTYIVKPIAGDYKRPPRAQPMDIDFSAIPFGQYYDTKEASEMFGVSPQAVRAWTEKGTEYFKAKSQEYTDGVTFTYIKGHGEKSQIYILRDPETDTIDNDEYFDRLNEDDNFEEIEPIDLKEVQALLRETGGKVNNQQYRSLENKLDRLVDLLERQQIQNVGGAGVTASSIVALITALAPLMPPVIDYLKERPSATDMLLDGIETGLGLAEQVKPVKEDSTADRLLNVMSLLKGLDLGSITPTNNKQDSQPIHKGTVKGDQEAMGKPESPKGENSPFNDQY